MAFALTASQRTEAAECYGLLNGAGSLREAVMFFMEHRVADEGSISVTAVYDALLAVQKRKGLEPVSIAATRSSLRQFVHTFGDRTVASIRYEDVNAWLLSLSVSATTLTRYIRYLNILFTYAVKHQYCRENPVSRVERPRSRYTMPAFIRPAGVQKIMWEAEVLYPSIVARLALGFFSGIRAKELDHVRWEHINLTEREILVTPDAAKNREPRTVTIDDNLATWLVAYRKTSGPIGPMQRAFMVRRQRVCKAVDVEWPQNAMRHSYATFHVARGRNHHITATEMGHHDTKMLRKHYKGLATAADADFFWTIAPQDTATILVLDRKTA